MRRSDKQFTRRAMLRGAGAMLALPFLEQFPLRALGATGTATHRPPMRMGIFSVTGGTVWESFVPREAGALGKLPSILRPLEPVKDQLLVISGLSQSGRCDGVNAHEHCAYKHLTGADFVKREGGKIYASTSVDQKAAEVVGKETVLPSLEMGLNANQYSFRGNEVVPYEANPRFVFDRMFRGRKPVVPNWSRRAEHSTAPAAPSGVASPDRSVIDLVLSQAKDLRRDLGRADQSKLDGYLESVRAVEKRMEFIESRHQQEVMDLASPGPSKLNIPANLPKPGSAYWEITNPMNEDPNKHADYINLLADLMVLAFQTDTTRVATIAAGSDDCMFPGVVTVGYERHCHTLEHQGNAGKPEEADPISREACRQIHEWYTGLFARMVMKMKQIDEGGSCLLDNTMLLYTSYMADGGHGQNRYPTVLVGNAQGTLKTGRHVAFKDSAPVSNLYVEMLDRMGIHCESFGDSQVSRFAGKLNSRLPGLA